MMKTGHQIVCDGIGRIIPKYVGFHPVSAWQTHRWLREPKGRYMKRRQKL